jgi:hypothetical protein
MKDIKLTIAINKPARDIFDFTLDPKNTPKWVDAIVFEQTNEWPLKVRTKYRNKDSAGVWREIELTEFEPDKMFVMSEIDGFHIRYTFTPVNEKTTELECYLWMDGGELKHTFSIEVLEKLKQVVEAE